jgi:hypothetical protein
MLLTLLTSLVLAALVGAVVVVWTGRPGWTRRWFDRPDVWSWLVWPFPVALPVGMLVAAMTIERVELLRRAVPEGSGTEVALWVAVGLVVSLWPPRWAFPGWARDRARHLPTRAATAEVADAATPALWCVHRRWRHALGPWRWRVGATRVAVHATADGLAVTELDGRPLAERDLPPLVAPRRLHVARQDVARLRRRRPWRRTGVTTIERHTQPPVHLWVRHAELVAALRGPRPRVDHLPVG